MIEPNDAGSAGILAAAAAGFLGLLRWLGGRQVGRIDSLEKWKSEVDKDRGEFRQMKERFDRMENKLDDVHKILMRHRRSTDEIPD